MKPVSQTIPTLHDNPRLPSGAKVIPLLLLSLLFLAARPQTMLAAAPPIATIVAVRGEVTATGTDNISRLLALKSDVFKEDTIKTGERGRIQMMFTDNSLISLGKNSELKIAEYEWDEKIRDGAMKTQVKEGVFRVMGGAITKAAPKKFTTETPAATIGIRGSMYAGKVEGDSLTVIFQGGKGIEIINEFGTVVITKVGFGTYVHGLLEPPKPPIKFTASEITNFNIDLSNEHSEQKEERNNLPDQEKERKEPPPVNGEERDRPIAAKEGEKVEESWVDQGEEWNAMWDEPDKFNQENDRQQLPPPEPGRFKDEQFFNPNDNLEPWRGYFSAVSGDRDIYTGNFGFMVNRSNGELYGVIPILLRAGNDNPLEFNFGPGHAEDNDFSVELFANNGPGNGIFVTAPQSEQIIPHLLWGYWGGDYIDPISGQVKFSSDLSFWIAGNKTPADRVNELIATNIHGKYEGPAIGVVQGADGQFSILQNGSSHLNINFGDHTVFGEILFDEIGLNISGQDIFGLLDTQAAGDHPPEPGSFSANIIEINNTNTSDEEIIEIGQVSGMIYGPNGSSIGGNFVAENDNNQYLGIFGGNFEDLQNMGFSKLSGKFTSAHIPFADQTSVTGRAWHGEVNAMLFQNFAEAEFAEANGPLFNFNFFIPESTDQTEYREIISEPFQNEIIIPGQEEASLVNMNVMYSNLGEFFIIKGTSDIFQNSGDTVPDSTFTGMGFAGLPSLSITASGIERYKGSAVTTIDNANYFTKYDLQLSVNWQTGKVIGFFAPPDFNEGSNGELNPAEMFFIGNVNGTEITNVEIFGLHTDETWPETTTNSPGALPSTSEWVDGTATDGQFYGSVHQGLGFSAEGTNILFSNNGGSENWQMVGAGFRGLGSEPAPDPGNSRWEGFIAGSSQIISPQEPGSATDRYRLLGNENPEDFSFIVNREAGQLDAGQMSVASINSADNFSVDLDIGPAALSAYVDDQTMVAVLAGDSVSARGFIATDPNFLPANPPEATDQINLPDYVAWGYWGVAYTDNNGTNYSTISGSSFWVAGERTPQDKIQDLVATGITATYDGIALGAELSPDGVTSQLPIGQTNLTADFGNNTISGSINFPGHVNLDLAPATISTLGSFNGTLSNTNGTSGQANGAFFGPNANTAAGNFNATATNNTAYTGVFGAGRN
ncbi:MAG: transferrin-binding protein-like solute binding protein [Proteobacteria bacterium]|nr:transferrin-binding protein-like solute binding protein [Pseudomonadota bacterium]MBU1713981.1 transferrin-binding protein-like solute binding protein [Pseudomonadota bacterium]